MEKNFRITTDYVLELLNVSTGKYHSIWIKTIDGKNSFYISDMADTTSKELEYDYSYGVLPSPPKNISTSNYRIGNQGILELLNPKTGLYYKIGITGLNINPRMIIYK